MAKGKHQTRSGQTATIYGRSRVNPHIWVGNVAGSFTVYEWRDDLTSLTSPDFDIVAPL